MSQRSAGEALGIGETTVQLYEAGKRPDPKRQGRTKAVPIPLHVELACAALALGIRSYNGPD